MTEMSDINSVIDVYTTARSEYTGQLSMYLVPAYFKFFLNMLGKAKELSGGVSKKLLWNFQSLLKDIPEWNMEKVISEISIIQQATTCDYLEELLTAVFIAHTKVLTSIRISSKQKKIEITVPKVDHFLFKLLCESSKLLWGNTYLFDETLSSIEKQKNYRQIEELIRESVMQTVRNMVPVKNLLRDFITNKDEDDDDTGGPLENSSASREEEEEAEETTEKTSATAEVEAEAEAEAGAEAKPISAPLDTSLEVSAPSAPSASASASASASTSAPSTSIDVSDFTPVPPTPLSQEEEAPPVISSMKKNIGFTDFDTVFDLRDPDIIYEPKDRYLVDDEDDGYDNIINSAEPVSLDDTDIEDVNQIQEQLDTGDFEELC